MAEVNHGFEERGPVTDETREGFVFAKRGERIGQ